MNLIVDVDDTLSDARWRQPLIMSEGWDAFHAAAPRDLPNAPIVALVNSLHRLKWYIVAVTARPDKYRAPTMSWLVRNGVEVDDLMLRPDKDWRPAPIVKLDLVQKRFPKIPKTSFLILDDREDTCAAFQAAGYMAFLMYQGPREWHNNEGGGKG